MFVTHLVVTFPCTDQEGANETAKRMRKVVEEVFEARWPMPAIEVKIQCNENEEAIQFEPEKEE